MLEHTLSPASPPSAASVRPAQTGDRHPSVELIEKIRRGLGPGNSRRVGLHHAELLQTMLEMEEAAPDVRDIYRALLDAKRSMVMASLYRSLRVLEEASIVQRDAVAAGGRLRSVYRVVDRLAAASQECDHSTCTTCGAVISKGAPTTPAGPI
mgnify:CR=1 FL=1